MIYEVKSFLELHEMLLRHGLKSVGDAPCGLSRLYVKIGDNKSARFGLNEIFHQVKPLECFLEDKPYVYSDYDNLIDDNLSLTHWGSGSIDQLQGEYTPMRQNLVLLCAALNGEFD